MLEQLCSKNIYSQIECTLTIKLENRAIKLMRVYDTL